MAPRRSVITSAKSIPGGARPTAAPQGLSSAPYQGGISPLVAQLDSGGATATWGGAYAGYLPRPTEDFTAGAFGPFSPILPVPVDAPAEGTDLPDPRLWQYPVGWNLPVGQPGTEGVKLADFNTLRTLADLYSVARACIQLRKSEIRALEWEILPTKDAAKSLRGDRKGMRDFGERRAEAEKFFRRPDPDFFSWTSWLDAALEEIFVFDALSLLFRMKWAKGKGKGLFGSDLDSLSLISGQTIRPLVDLHGARPRPPAPAYQQYLYGVPRCDLMSLIMERDIEDGGLSGAEMNRYRADQLLYLPMVPRRWTPYGFPPIERALVPVVSGLQKQGWQLDYFRDGTVPAVYISPGGSNANMTPNQIRELQDALNAIAGDPAWHHRIIVLPPDSTVMPQRQQQLADQFDEIVMAQVCMAFDVQPMELGISPKVSTTQSPGAANQMAKASQDIHQRKATKPLLMYLTDIFNMILQDVCGQPDMRFVFEGLEEKEDENTKTDTLVAQVGGALRSIDEAREELNLQPWGLPETSDPGWATPTGGWVPLAQAVQAHQTSNAEGPLFSLDDSGQPVPVQQPVQASQGPAQAPGKESGNAGQSPGHEAAEGASDGAEEKTPGTAKTARAVHPGAARHQARRGQHVEQATADVMQQLSDVVTAYKTGRTSAPEAIGKGVAALAAGYRRVMAQAQADARQDHGVAKQDDDDGGGIDDPETDGAAMQRAESQRPYLMGLLKAVAAAGAAGLAGLKARLALYGRSLTAAYNSAYAAVLRKAPDTYAIVWRLGTDVGDHCVLCVDRDGKSYTWDTLPGFPGEGGFGELCMGGPACDCSLEYVKQAPALPVGYKRRAAEAELEALARHVRKGRLLSSWQPRHVSGWLLARVAEDIDEGLTVDEAVMAAKARLRVDLNGQAYREEISEAPTVVSRSPSGGGGVPAAAHTADGVPVPVLEQDVPGAKPDDLIGYRWTVPDLPVTAVPRTGKGASDLSDPTPVDAEHVINQMRSNYPDKALGWMRDARWIGPVQVPLERIDVEDADTWAASHEPKRVRQFAKDIKHGRRHLHPVVAVQEPGDDKIKIIDGHHRALAYKRLGRPVTAYVGFVDRDGGPWDDTHLYQEHSGLDRRNKARI